VDQIAHQIAQGQARRPAHPLPIRIMHWIGAIAIICMFLSGWAIYNASPSLPFTFPRGLTLGGWLAAGIAWHISMMWVLFADGLAYLAYGTMSGHFWRDLRPTGPRAVLRDLWDALRFRLPHRLGHYNAVQRLLYSAVILFICVAVLSGLSIWKPVQLGWLTGLFGGYPLARHIHLAMMFCIVTFLAVHLVLVALYPRTLVSMVASTDAEEAP
jgi:thiosulfate reductase cytochrome b subunit